jgi:hypothetical protein
MIRDLYTPSSSLRTGMQARTASFSFPTHSRDFGVSVYKRMANDNWLLGRGYACIHTHTHTHVRTHRQGGKMEKHSKKLRCDLDGLGSVPRAISLLFLESPMSPTVHLEWPSIHPGGDRYILHYGIMPPSARGSHARLYWKSREVRISRLAERIRACGKV